MKTYGSLVLGGMLICMAASCETVSRSTASGPGSDTKAMAFRDTSLSLDARIADLVSRMTLEEKASQMMYNSPAIPRLGVPAYNWWNECLHGVARSGRATVFPQAIGLGATFDQDLIFRIGTAISDEARAMHHAAVREGSRLQYGGLTFWTPNINIFRDPRWGRGQETYGEDPFLTGELGSALVRGLQGDDPRYLKVAACAKHYAVHSGPEKDRHVFNAQASPKDLFETYLPAFKTLVDAGVETVMCAYNRTNDEPCCGNQFLLQDVLRGRWGFKGHVVSDCWALIDFHEGHKVTASIVESAALALKRGVNLNCGSTFPHLPEAVRRGLVREEEIDRSLSVLLRTRFKLGLFDPDEKNPYTRIRPEVVHCQKHRDLAYQAAVESLVLLKNAKAVLPLKKDIRYVFVTGPCATSAEVLLGNYYGVSDDLVTLLEGIASKRRPGTFVQYKQGFLMDRENVNPMDWTSGDAKQADAIIVCMGISGTLEGEEGEAIASPYKGDRLDLGLPAHQVQFLQKLRKDYDRPLIVVLTGGSPFAMQQVHDLADAVLMAWYPGEQGGRAVADVLFGDASPSGRLPITFPKSLAQVPPYDDYRMTGRTYRYMTEEPLYPFGFGLGYGKVEYTDLRLDRSQVRSGQSVQVGVRVTNTGSRPVAEVVQLYLADLDASVPVPRCALKDIQRIHLEPGQSRTVTFTLLPEAMHLIDETGTSRLEPGQFKVFVGGSSPGPRSVELGSPAPAEGVFTVM